MTTTGTTGVELIDGKPFFATHEGQRLNRRQWLAATADDRRANLVNKLRSVGNDDDTDFSQSATEQHPALSRDVASMSGAD